MFKRSTGLQNLPQVLMKETNPLYTDQVVKREARGKSMTMREEREEI